MKFFWLIILITSSKIFFGQEPIIITDSFIHQDLARQLTYAEDKTKSLSLEKALKLNYKSVEQNVPNYGFNNSSYWFKGMVINATTQWQSPIIQIANPNIDVVNLTVFSKKIGRHKKYMGDLLPFKNRGNTNKYFQFNVQLLPHDTIQFILNVQNSGEQFHVPMSIGSPDYYHESDSNEQLAFGIYFGFILFVTLLNLFFYYVLKDTASLFYIGYLVCLLFLQLSLTGFGFKYFWPNSVFLANHANPIFASISMLCLLLFSQLFLNTKVYLPKLNKGIIYLKYYFVIIIICAWVPVNELYVFSVISINALSLILIVVIIPSTIYILKQNYKPARFFLTAFIFLIISVLLFVLKNAGLVPSNPFTNYGLQMGSAMEVLLLTLAVIDKFSEFKIEAVNRLQEVNDLKTKANAELEEKVEERTKQISAQKITLEYQNEEIKSSIRYAKRIQDSLLPPHNIMDELFHKNYFVYYKPKDIVSGDFYWAAPVSTSSEPPYHLSLAAVVDCTGHGVPGAFMSIVGSNFLKQSLTEKTVNNVAEALNFLNKNIISTLHQSSNAENKVRDGMDVALIALDYEKNKLYYSGANNAIYILRKQVTETEIIILKATKQSIGSVSDIIQTYHLEVFDLQKGDTIYLFSDGYADQFGDLENKKLNYKRFKAILTEAFNLPIHKQKAYIQSRFESWLGNAEQTDDVCVMGIKI